MRLRPAWRGLGVFWIVVVAGVGGGLGVLQWLGPLPHAPAPAAAADHEAPAEHRAAFDDVAPPAKPAVASPDPALLERSTTDPQLMLPHTGPGGAAARIRYAAPVPPIPPGAKRVAILVAGFGKSDADSRAALDKLPDAVSLAVSAYAAPRAAGLLEAARVHGHELLVSIPMEPDGYPLNDEGTRSLRTGLSPGENQANLEWALGQVPGAVGATGASDGMRGERFAGLPAAFDPALDEILRRGLLYLDPRPDVPGRPAQPVRSVNVVLDDSQARAELEVKLAALERAARENGSAIGLVGQIRPMTLDRLATWVQGLPGRGLVLVPVSNLVDPK